MIVYHGGANIIQNPEVKFSRNYLDFGKGFYLTTYERQAKDWAIRKARRKSTVPIVNKYELEYQEEDWNVLRFEGEDEEWLDFVSNCRKGEMSNEKFDIIIGSVADDDVFKTVDMYLKGLWEKERVLKELRYHRLNNQICITNQVTINKTLKFMSSYEVKSNG